MQSSRILFLALIALAASFASSAAAGLDASPKRRELTLHAEAIHDIGRVGLNVTNWGLIGSRPGLNSGYSHAASLEYPLGSGVQNLFASGIWVGGIVDGVPHVSTGQYSTEFLADPVDPADTVYESFEGADNGSRLRGTADDDHDRKIDEDPLNGFDDDGDGRVDEDFAAIGEQYFHAQMRDDEPLSQELLPDHDPMGLRLRQESFAWSDERVDDLIGFRLHVQNVGSHRIENAFVGLFADFDIGWSAAAQDAAENDLVGYEEFAAIAELSARSVHVNLGYAYDGDGSGPFAGVVLLSHEGSSGPLFGAHGFRYFQGQAAFADHGDPTNDAERYEALSEEVFDETPAFGDQSRMTDYRVLLSAGPFETLEPGDEVSFEFALVMGDDLESLRANAANAVALAAGRRIRGQIVPWSLPSGHGRSDEVVHRTRGARARPNPFNPRVEIVFSTTRAGTSRVEVFDARGRSVRLLAEDFLPAGEHRKIWDGQDQSGHTAASGTYFLRITTPEGVETIRAVLVR